MKAYDLYKIDPPKISPGNDFTTPHVPNGEIDMEPINMNSDPNPIPNTPENGSKSFPWGKALIILSVVVVTYLILKTPQKKITEEELDSHHQA